MRRTRELLQDGLVEVEPEPDVEQLVHEREPEEVLLDEVQIIAHLVEQLPARTLFLHTQYTAIMHILLCIPRYMIFTFYMCVMKHEFCIQISTALWEFNSTGFSKTSSCRCSC